MKKKTMTTGKLISCFALLVALGGIHVTSQIDASKEVTIQQDGNITSADRHVVSAHIASILPPKYKPGDTITKVDYASVDKALDDVLRAGSIGQRRRCAVGVANLGTTSLSSPRWYIKTGSIFTAAPYTVKARKTALVLFQSNTVALWQSTGVLTYNIEGTDYQLAVTWKVPWNSLTGIAEFNVKVYPQSMRADRKMFNQMLEYAGSQTSQGWLTRQEYGIKVLATINDSTHTKLYVSVDATGHDRSNPGMPHIHVGCSKTGLDHPTWMGAYCWRECPFGGYCWTERRCQSTADCAVTQCYEKCRKA